MNVYRISILPGVDPLILSKSTQGFIEAPTQVKAVAMFLKHPGNKWQDLPHDRVVAEPRSKVKGWDIERELFPLLPKSV
jgi:hypothetical protein